MIATMDQYGVITLEAETGAEAYALQKWCEESICDGHISTGKLLIIGGIATKESEHG